MLVPKQYLGAFKRGHRANTREFIDESLSWKLLKQAKNGDKEALKALEWLTRFNNEFHKNVLKKDGKSLHETEEERKKLYSRENAKNRDIASNWCRLSWQERTLIFIP